MRKGCEVIADEEQREHVERKAKGGLEVDSTGGNGRRQKTSVKACAKNGPCILKAMTR